MRCDAIECNEPGTLWVSIAQHDQARIGVSLPNKVTEESSERLDEKEFGSLDGRKVPHMRNK